MRGGMAAMTNTTHATGTFTEKSWDESSYAELEGAPKLTQARVVTTYAGDLEGEGQSTSVMVYPAADRATYVGYERVVGRLGGREGSFVVRAEGTFQDGAARTTWTIEPGSGTGELVGLRGEGRYVARHGESAVAYEFDYRLED